MKIINSKLINFYSIPENKNYIKLLNLIKSNKPLKILDVGCGDGKNTKKIKEFCPNSQIYGIDFFGEGLKNAKKYGIIIKEVNLEKENFPFQDNFFDIVISNMVIEHIDDLEHFISEQKRVLKKNGELIISTNNASSWHNIVALIFGWQPFDLTNVTLYSGLGNPLAIHRGKSHKENLKGMCHKRIYTIKFIKEFLKIKGFSNINSYGEGYFPLPSIFGRLDKIHSQFFIIEGEKI